MDATCGGDLAYFTPSASGGGVGRETKGGGGGGVTTLKARSEEGKVIKQYSRIVTEAPLDGDKEGVYEGEDISNTVKRRGKSPTDQEREGSPYYACPRGEKKHGRRRKTGEVCD